MKVKEYKESMYFDAVKELLTKIGDPKTKGSTKASLQKQLRELGKYKMIDFRCELEIIHVHYYKYQVFSEAFVT